LKSCFDFVWGKRRIIGRQSSDITSCNPQKRIEAIYAMFPPESLNFGIFIDRRQLNG
jgi:hypothetical protein